MLTSIVTASGARLHGPCGAPFRGIHRETGREEGPGTWRIVFSRCRPCGTWSLFPRPLEIRNDGYTRGARKREAGTFLVRSSPALDLASFSLSLSLCPLAVRYRVTRVKYATQHEKHDEDGTRKREARRKVGRRVIATSWHLRADRRRSVLTRNHRTGPASPDRPTPMTNRPDAS